MRILTTQEKTAQEAREQYWLQAKEWAKAQLAQGKVLEDNLNIVNPEAQMGRLMWPNQLENGLNRLISNLVFEVHPSNPSKKCLYQIRDGKKYFLLAYENGPMSEYSIMKGVVKYIPDPDFMKMGADGSPRVHMERRYAKGAAISNQRLEDMLNAKGWDATLTELQKRNQEIPDSERPGFKKVVQPGREGLRGWRTVLAKLVLEGLLSPAQAEKEFGSGQGAAWAKHTGRLQVDSVPW
jgi:hypothetical protein